ncbi:seed maturation [Micractinium conductrix]|uniref:Seed maturation n=1 Tax=Micractinium conductrix TaxID=554055 RepID=A0A2P6VHJ1_9CHLO|nr:seed maturation [Micractinium conductrix]|eukprot:PSC73550.1 seed maturation [Micractinium conductrix]
MLQAASCPAAAARAASHCASVRRSSLASRPPSHGQRRWTGPRRAGAAAWGGGSGSGSSGGGGGGDAWQQAAGSERLRLLTKFVSEVDPGVMQQFETEAHPSVLVAMRQTITNMLGTLPPQFFRVVISTEAENLAQLMYSVLLSGYMFANAWTRLSLTQSLTGGEPVRALIEPELASLYGTAVDGGGEPVAVPAAAAAAVGSGSLDDAAYAPGTQKVRVEGEVLRWHHENGKEVVPALMYIEQLERELADLRQQIEDHQAAERVASAASGGAAPLPGNELLDYLKQLSPEELVALTDHASEDVMQAMNVFVERLMGMEEEAWQGGTSDCTAGELAQLMYWLMITGYSLRQLEQRCDLTRTLDLDLPCGSSSDGGEPPSLPPGRRG